MESELERFPEIGVFLQKTARLRQLNWYRLRSLPLSDIKKELLFLGDIGNGKKNSITLRAKKADIFSLYAIHKYAKIITGELKSMILHDNFNSVTIEDPISISPAPPPPTPTASPSSLEESSLS